MRTGFYPGSFDPVTLGHADIIRHAVRLVDRLVIGIGVHPSKKPLFSEDERRAMLAAEWALIRRSTDALLDIVTFDGLAVAAAKAHDASVIIRGLRDGTDLDYEMQLAGMNGAMEPTIDTVFLPASPEVRHVAATLVRQIALMGGDVTPFVSPAVARQLRAKRKSMG